MKSLCYRAWHDPASVDYDAVDTALRSQPNDDHAKSVT